MLENTGERVIPDLMKPTSSMLLEHIARYYFSLVYTRGRVLDIACGSGFGSQYIAEQLPDKVTEVAGVDIDPEILEYAESRYPHHKVRYLAGDALDPAFCRKIGTFDTILSFETIEHVPDDQLFMKNIYGMLKPGGRLILSTPFGEGRSVPSTSRFHYFQLTPAEFKGLVEPFEFDSVEFYYQTGPVIEKTPRPEANYSLGIAVCQKNAAP